MRRELAQQGYRAVQRFNGGDGAVRLPILLIADDCCDRFGPTPNCECECLAEWHIDSSDNFDIMRGERRPVYACRNCSCPDYVPIVAPKVAIPPVQLDFGIAVVNGTVALFALPSALLSAVFRLLYGHSIIGQVPPAVGTVEFGAFRHGS